MKKILLFLLITIPFTNINGQKASHDAKAVYFVKCAVREFRLDLKQYKALLIARRTYINGFISNSNDYKSGKISEEEKNTNASTLGNNFNTAFSRITDKPLSELHPFSARVRKQLRKM